ncbi:pyridoxamine 5'-phosphate oxidase family protein [Plantibacter sp. ME-Dv--P-122b]|uniref:pyridoxamine 5'-phosphate oxidase family protein n=1 Tax=Plantibacter sp. ME-Dv--P-122b TaxID=3040300 RepID=UPI00254CB0F8|nr:pyridoxamine 5'-phosphate oxidase family protein [Plantibacter sp. ME-Dv--P-122b]
MNDQTPVSVLGEDACWERLSRVSIGRLAMSVGGRPDIFPISYVVDGHTIVIRTNPGDKLVELTINDQVALEVDHYDDAEAWSVVVKGTAEQLQHGVDIDIAERLALTTLIPISTEVFVRITPEQVYGRTFDLTAERPEPV